MRKETKIALGLFAIGMVIKYIMSMPDFISGLLLGLSLFFMVIGLLPENTYVKFKVLQMKKLSLLKGFAKLN